MMYNLVKCDFGDWVGIAVLAGIGLFSLIFLGLGIAVAIKYLFARNRNSKLDTL